MRTAIAATVLAAAAITTTLCTGTASAAVSGTITGSDTEIGFAVSGLSANYDGCAVVYGHLGGIINQVAGPVGVAAGAASGHWPVPAGYIGRLSALVVCHDTVSNQTDTVLPERPLYVGPNSLLYNFLISNGSASLVP